MRIIIFPWYVAPSSVLIAALREPIRDTARVRMGFPRQAHMCRQGWWV